MQVRSGRVAGHADVADDLALRDGAVDAHEVVEVRVVVDVPVVAGEVDDVAAAARLVRHVVDVAGAHGVLGAAEWLREVDAGVEAGAARPEAVAPHGADDRAHETGQGRAGARCRDRHGRRLHVDGGARTARRGEQRKARDPQGDPCSAHGVRYRRPAPRP